MFAPLLLLGVFDFDPIGTVTPPWRIESLPKQRRIAEVRDMTWAPKDPNDVADYAIDWTRWLDGDTIESSTFSVNGASGVSIASQTATDTLTTVWLTGGTSGREARVVNSITTADGRSFDKTMMLAIRER